MWSRRLFAVVLVATLGLYGVMLFWSIPELTRDASGLAIFDMRPGGYDFDEARVFLRALSPTGAAFYETVQHRLDAAYPILLAITLGWSILRLTPAVWGNLRYPLAATAVPGMIFDYLENTDVAAMLTAGADGITPEMVATASFHSQAKAWSTSAAMILLLFLAALWLTRRWRGPGNPV